MSFWWLILHGHQNDTFPKEYIVNYLHFSDINLLELLSVYYNYPINFIVYYLYNVYCTK